MRRTVIAVLMLASASHGADRRVAITFDDLPRGGDGGGRGYEEIREMTVRLLAPIRAGRIPVTALSIPAAPIWRPPTCAAFWTSGWMPERNWATTPGRTWI